MRAKDVLDLWDSWEFVDIFTIWATASNGRIVAIHNLTGSELITSSWADMDLKRFGSYGKGADGVWRHYIEVAALPET